MSITMINKENREYFLPLMPKHIWQESEFVFGAIEEGVPCGILAVSKTEEHTLSILYLYVDEMYQRKGIATELLKQLHNQGKDAGYDFVICQFLQNEKTEILAQCFKSAFFEEDENRSLIYAVRLGDLSEKLLNKKDSPAYVCPLSKVTRMMWNELLGQLEKLPNAKEMIPVLKDKNNYDQNVSFFLLEDRKVRGCILFEKTDAEYILSYFCLIGELSPIKMMALLRESYSILKESCKEDTIIYVNALTETTQKMVMQISEGKAQLLGEAVTYFDVF